MLYLNRECAASVWPQCWEMTLAVYLCDCDLFGSTDGSWRAPSWRLPGSVERKKQVFFGLGYDEEWGQPL